MDGVVVVFIFIAIFFFVVILVKVADIQKKKKAANLKRENHFIIEEDKRDTVTQKTEEKTALAREQEMRANIINEQAQQKPSSLGNAAQITDVKNYKSNFTHLESHLKHYGRPNETVTVEKNIPYQSSAGKNETVSGCGEHYDQRFLVVDSNYAIQKEKIMTKAEKTRITDAIVYGKILNDPAFKRRYKGRN